MKVDFKVGKRSRFRDQEFWPEGGMICLENRNTGNFKVLARAEAAARAIALNEEMQYITYPDERDELLKCICELAEAVKEAKRQGDPTDPEVRRQRIKDNKKVSFMIERESVAPEPPAFPHLDKAPFFNKSGYIISDRFKNLQI